jgi:hypothetical protein
MRQVRQQGQEGQEMLANAGRGEVHAMSPPEAGLYDRSWLRRSEEALPNGDRRFDALNVYSR